MYVYILKSNVTVTLQNIPKMNNLVMCATLQATLFYNTLHDIGSIHTIVASTVILSFWEVFFLWIWEVVVESSTEGLVEACTPVLRPILD